MLIEYPVSGKRKSADLCRAFIEGAGKAAENAAVFYGVDASNIAKWKEVRRFNRPFYYMDNSFFDETRGTHFRIAKGQLQGVDFARPTDGKRFDALGIEMRPWKQGGQHIVVCPQSDSFMRDLVCYPGDWLQDTLQHLNEFFPHRTVVVRDWQRDKIAAMRSLPKDLDEAVMLYTHSSMAAVTALIHGVPSNTAATHVLHGKTNPLIDRRSVLAPLADAQWTIEEIRRGDAWRYLNP